MFPLLTLRGTPRERGRLYGATAAAQIRHSIASYARLFAYRRGLDWATSQHAALAYIPLLEQHVPQLLEEICGIAEGADLDSAAILALNVRTELLAGTSGGPAHLGYRAALARNQQAGVPMHPTDPAEVYATVTTDQGECTTVVAQPNATADEITLLAQTWDWTGDQRAACVLLRIEEPGRPTILTLTEAGILAKIGLNSAGLGVSLNLLRSRTDGYHLGMPIHILLRAILERETVPTTVQLIERVAIGASSCVTLADANGRAVSLELTPTAIGVVPPSLDGLLAHTNHCVMSATVEGEAPLDPSSTSLQRLDRASLLLSAQRGMLDIEDLQRLLADHTGEPQCICRHPDPRLHPAERAESVTGVIMDLERRVMHVAPGLPCQVAFIPVTVM